jgi:hypothetical protein
VSNGSNQRRMPLPKRVIRGSLTRTPCARMHRAQRSALSCRREIVALLTGGGCRTPLRKCEHALYAEGNCAGACDPLLPIFQPPTADGCRPGTPCVRMHSTKASAAFHAGSVAFVVVATRVEALRSEPAQANVPATRPRARIEITSAGRSRFMGRALR